MFQAKILNYHFYKIADKKSFLERILNEHLDDLDQEEAKDKEKSKQDIEEKEDDD